MKKTYDRHVRECLLVSHPYVRSRGYADTAKPWLEKEKN